MLVLTELDAVNKMLEMIGEQPVHIIDPNGVPEANIALGILLRTSQAVQANGLACNTEYHYRLLRDTQGEILVPVYAHVLRASDQTTYAVQRGRRMYNGTTHSYTWTVPSLEVDMISILEFEELPMDVRWYITVVAGRQFSKSVLGSDTLAKLTEEDEYKAKAEMESNEAIRINGNYLRSNPTPNNVMRRRTVLGPI